jgi:hypothetical protein
MKTPIRLAQYAWNRTPGLQLVSKSLYNDIAAGGVAADKAIGRLTLSNLAGMYFYELAQEGFITGSGPVDPALRRSWLATHNPYSLRTKDGLVPISNFEPANTFPGLVADYAQIINQLDEPEAEQVAMAVMFAGVRNFADKTYWKTFGDVTDLVAAVRFGEEPGHKFAQTARGPLTTITTGGPLMAATARAIDPVMRDARAFVDERMARLPGYSKTVPAVRDGYGDPVLSQQAWTIGGPWVGIVSPFALKPHETDRVKLEGARLQAKLPSFPFQIGGRVTDDFDLRAPQPGDRLGVALSPQQRDRWQDLYRRIVRHPELGIESQVLNRTEYQGLTLAGQRETFTSYLYDAKSMALDALLVEDKELGKRSLEQEAANIAPLLQRQEQEALSQQTKESINLYDTLAPEMRDNLLRWGVLEPQTEEGTPP